MKHLIITLSLFTLHLSLPAAVPVRWTVETSRVQPAVFEAYQGETLDLAASLQSYGRPVSITGDTRLYWQTNGMGARWWTAPASVSSNVLSAVWSPTNDVGARSYSCFIGQPGSNYRAEFQLRLRPSPGASPNQLPLPTVTYDARLNGTPTVNGTNLVDIISSNIGHEVAAFSSTGTVARAASVGTAEQWTDATGCVWRTSVGVGEWKMIGSVPSGYQSVDFPMFQTWAGDLWTCGAVDENGVHHDAMFGATGGENATHLNFHDFEWDRSVSLTNLVGRVAMTNDVMPRAEVEARFADVDRPYSMIYDPVAGRALTADGRLVDYGRAPRIAGHFVLTPDAAMSSGNLPDGFMPTLALLGGRTNLVEGVDWTSSVTPSSPDGSGGYYVSTADIAWLQTNSGYYTVGVLPVSAQIVKTVSSFGTSCTLSLGGVVSPYYVVDVPGVGTGEVSIYDSDIAGDTVMLYWSFYDYTYWTSYYGSDVFRLRFVDEGGDGVQAVAFGNRGRFATLSDMQSQVEEAIDDRVGSMDSVRSLEIMRNDGPLELGSGPGILKWDFVTDDREWILTVPNLSAAMRVYTSYSGTTEYTGYPYDSYAVPEIRERTFVRSWGNAGNGRCLASQWHVVGAIGDAEFIVDAIVSNGVVRVLSNVQEPPIYGMSIGDPAYPSASFSTYSGLALSGDGTSSVRFYRGTLVSGGPSGSSTTRWPTLHLTTASGSYTVVTGAYMRALGPETKDLHWDPGLRRTWRVGVSNGCFFAEIASTNNLLYTETHQ